MLSTTAGNHTAEAYFTLQFPRSSQFAAEIFETVWLGVDFHLHLPFRPESTLYLPNPRRARGGVARSLTSSEIRIDYV